LPCTAGSAGWSRRLRRISGRIPRRWKHWLIRRRHWLIRLRSLFFSLRAAEVGDIGLLLANLVDGVFFRREELHERHLRVSVRFHSVFANLLQVEVLNSSALI